MRFPRLARCRPAPSGFRLETPDGASSPGVHIPGDEPAQGQDLILGFGGNGWNGQDVAEYLHQLFPDHDVVAFHYRGYSPSTGSPSAEAADRRCPAGLRLRRRAV